MVIHVKKPVKFVIALFIFPVAFSSISQVAKRFYKTNEHLQKTQDPVYLFVCSSCLNVLIDRSRRESDFSAWRIGVQTTEIRK